MKKCNICLNTRPIVSENGIHSICTLSSRSAMNCLFGKTNKFVPRINPIKIFVSVGIGGRADSDINEDLRRANDNIRNYCNEYYKIDPKNIEIINTYNCEAPADASSLWYLGESIKKLGECSICYFVKGWKNHKGCAIEMEVCKSYGIEVIEEAE